MNKFVLGALALAASSTPCLAGSDSEYTKLDRDIESLATSLRPAASGASVSGFLRTAYKSSSDVDNVGGSGNDLGGFSIDQARLNVSGMVGNYSLFVSVEGANDGFAIFGDTSGVGDLNILDAHVSWPLTPEIRGQMGVFTAPFLGSSLHSEDRTLFMDRSVMGDVWSGRDEGLQVSGNFEMVSWAVAIMNGGDDAGDDLAWAARATFAAMGAANHQEGAYGATDQTSLTIGVGARDDQFLDEGDAFCVDGNFTMGVLSASFEFVDQGADIGDNAPWDVAFGYMISPDQWEAAVRYEDADDDDNTTAITAGLNWYQSGHAAKWQFNYSTISSDLAANEVDVIQFGVTASI